MEVLLGVGIVGCGAVTLHRHAPEYAAHPQVALRGWVDGQAGRAQAMADRYGGVVYDSLEQLLDRPDIDAVSICVANAQHAAYACQALEAGKHVLCEKPMAMDSQEAAQMVKVAQAAGHNLFIGQNQRLAPAHRQAKELLDLGALGRIIRVTSTFAHAGPESWSVDGAGSWFFDPNAQEAGRWPIWVSTNWIWCGTCWAASIRRHGRGCAPWISEMPKASPLAWMTMHAAC